MLQPKRTKFRRSQKGRMKGNAQRGNQLAFGSFGIKALEEKWIEGRQIEAARVAVTRYMQRQGQIWIRIFPDKPITKKPDRRRETKRSDADCLQNDRTRADRHSAGTLMLFVYPSYGAVYLHRRFGLSRCLYSFFAGYLLCFDRYELRNSTVRSRIRYR